MRYLIALILSLFIAACGSGEADESCSTVVASGDQSVISCAGGDANAVQDIDQSGSDGGFDGFSERCIELCLSRGNQLGTFGFEACARECEAEAFGVENTA